MKNALSYKFYMVTHQASTWVVLGVSFAYSLFIGFSFSVILGNNAFAVSYRELMNSYGAAMSQLYGMDFSELLALIVERLSIYSFADFVELGLSIDLPVFITTFVVFSANREKRCGMPASLGTYITRKQDLFANVILISAYSLVLFILAFIGFSAMYTVGFEEGGLNTVNGWFFLSVFIKFGLLSSVGFLSMLMTDLFPMRRTISVFSLFYVLFISSWIYSALDMLTEGLNMSIRVDFLMPIGAFSAITYRNTGSLIVGGCVFLIYVALFLALEFYVVPKKDRV